MLNNGYNAPDFPVIANQSAFLAWQGQIPSPGGRYWPANLQFHDQLIKADNLNWNLSASLNRQWTVDNSVVFIEFQIAYRHPFVGAVIDRPRKCTEFQNKFALNGTFSPKEIRIGHLSLPGAQ